MSCSTTMDMKVSQTHLAEDAEVWQITGVMIALITNIIAEHVWLIIMDTYLFIKPL
jgi:hypothetical protein